MSSGEPHRKLTAIFSADVKDYSRLMGDDEAATVRTLTAYRQVLTDSIQIHRGRVVDSPGDNLLAEFASVVDAVQAAMAVQKELGRRNAELSDHRRMDFRIGINLGDVIVEEGRLYGDGVNVAARIEGLAVPGGICLSAGAYEQVKSKLDVEGKYLGQFDVKNIAEPVRVWALLTDATSLARTRARRERRQKSRRLALLAAAAAVVAVGSVTVWNLFLRSPTVEGGAASVEKMALPLPDKPSIAVLPFDNLSDDPEQAYFSNGLTEEIVATLSRVPKLFVIDPGATDTYKGKPITARQASEELGVRYVLMGSVRKYGNKVKITSKLTDAISGKYLWAETYNKDIDDILSVQEEITKKIVTAMQVELTEGEQARTVAKGTDNIDAYLKSLQSLENLREGNKESIALGKQLAEEAIALDPEYPMAYRALGSAYMMEVFTLVGESREQNIAKCIELFQKAIELDETYAEAYSSLSFIYATEGQHDKSIETAEHGVELNPNSADAHMYLGHAFRFAGRNEDAIPVYKIAMRLHPNPPYNYLWGLGKSYALLGRYEEALPLLERSVQLRPNNSVAHGILTEAYVYAGRIEDARRQAAEILRINPKFSLREFAKASKSATSGKTMDALREAGLPE